MLDAPVEQLVEQHPAVPESAPPVADEHVLDAALNETLRHTLSFGDWLAAKLWVFMPLSFLFMFTQLPMLLRHGLAPAAEDEVVENPPPE